MSTIKNKLHGLKTKITEKSQEIRQSRIDKKIYAPSKINVKLVGFWAGVDSYFLGLPFVNALKKAYENVYGEKKEWQLCSYKSDIDFFSVNADTDAAKKSKAKLKIFYTGEDVNFNYKRFKNLMINEADLSIGFDYEEDRGNAPDYIRYPFWLLRYFGYTEDKDTIKAEVDKLNSIPNSKERFCCFVASHDDDGLRKKVLDVVENVETVSCGGNAYHNDDSLRNEFGNDKIKYLSHFMFNLCPENVSVRGYTTEKIFESFAGGCIPVYYGSDGVPESFVNTKAVVMFDGKNADDVIEQIRLLKDDENYYNDFIKQTKIFDSAVDCIYEMNRNLRIKYEEILRNKR